MRREALSLEDVCRHEAGHLAFVRAHPGLELVTLHWCCDPPTETLHAEARTRMDWASDDERDRSIDLQVSLALAGGVAETLAAGSELGPEANHHAIVQWTGWVDYELAHDWASKRAQQPGEGQIQADILRLWDATSEVLAAPTTRSDLAATTGALLRLRHGLASGNHRITPERLADATG